MKTLILHKQQVPILFLFLSVIAFWCLSIAAFVRFGLIYAILAGLFAFVVTGSLVYESILITSDNNYYRFCNDKKKNTIQRIILIIAVLIVIAVPLILFSENAQQINKANIAVIEQTPYNNLVDTDTENSKIKIILGTKNQDKMKKVILYDKIHQKMYTFDISRNTLDNKSTNIINYSIRNYSPEELIN